MNSTLSIAGTAFRISSMLDLYYPEEAGPLYRFARQPSSQPDVNIAVEVRPGTRNDFDAMNVVAEAESAWKLVDDGDDRWFVSCFKLPHGMPAWAARTDRACRTVTVEYNVDWEENYGRVPSPIIYPLDQLLLIHALASRRGMIVHGAGVRKGDEAVLMAGVSGAGKTTISDIVDMHTELEILSDDRIVIREQDGMVRAHGTPWPGEGGYALNDSGRLKCICFLSQGDECVLRPLDEKAVVERLMPVSSVPWYDEELMGSVLDFAGSAAAQVPGYELVFTKDADSARLVESLFDG